MSFGLDWPLGLRVTALALSIFVICLPFGAWRVRARSKSLSWWLAIHVPIPLFFLLRRGLDLSFWFIAVSVAAAIAGQYTGGRIWPPDSALRKTHDS